MISRMPITPSTMLVPACTVTQAHAFAIRMNSGPYGAGVSCQK
jgi:hypothetical protein